MSKAEPILYLDTSVLLPYYRREPASSYVEQWLSRLTKPLRISALTEVEFASAIARIVRMNELDNENARQITNLFEKECRDGLFHKMPLNTSHYKQAKAWLSSRVTALRTLDALHLACSHSLRAEMVTADRVLHIAAGQLHVQSRLLA